MKIVVAILNWNGEKFLRRFLGNVYSSLEGLDAQLVVADNGSTDGSVDYVRQEFPNVRLILFDQNYGFTGGYNRALKEIDAEYVTLLNSDIEVDPDWLAPIIRYMDEHPDCAGCQPKILQFDHRDTFEYAGAAGGLLDRYGFPFCRGRIIDKLEKDHGQYDEPATIFWASGAALTVRKSVWDALGGLDDSFFAHQEEVDWCWRAQLAGYELHYIPDSKVYHIGGGTLETGSSFKMYLNYRNNIAMLRKCLPATVGEKKARWKLFVRKVFDYNSVIYYIITGQKGYAKALLKAYKDLKSMKIDVITEGKPLARGMENKMILL
ncbi:MAG: glycosyltransferase family 2 protein [Bacteroidales bacterium]|nr:glycosyltransferase family 2 protein [Bacteroidales bacterium]